MCIKVGPYKQDTYMDTGNMDTYMDACNMDLYPNDTELEPTCPATPKKNHHNDASNKNSYLRCNKRDTNSTHSCSENNPDIEYTVIYAKVQQLNKQN